MSNRPDWNEWILEKNAAHAQEELKKSEYVSAEELEKGIKDLYGKHKAKMAMAALMANPVVTNYATIPMLSGAAAGDAAINQGKTFPGVMRDIGQAAREGVRLQGPGGMVGTMYEGFKNLPTAGVTKAEDMSGDEIDNGMMMSDLESLEHHIKEIREHLDAKDLAPDWVKSKVARSAAMMSDIAHYIQGLKERK